MNRRRVTHAGRLRVCLAGGLLLAMLSTPPAVGQMRDVIPGPTYYAAVDEFYAGGYRDAERALRRETRRGVRSTHARWIDSICYHAMLGEVLYHQGRPAEALAEFDQACQLFLAYPNWLLRVNFQQPPRVDTNRARRVPPWGRSERQFTLGQFQPVELVSIGQLDVSQAVREGGIVATPQFWRVDVAEIVRTTALAIRRRNEILGPLARHDNLSRELSDVLARGNLAPTNHWSRVWIDLQRGLALVGMGRAEEADSLLGRATVAGGQFDHPLTCAALLERGRLAMLRGEGRAAAGLLAEAGFSAYYYENWDVLTESIMLGWVNHLAGGGTGVYPPLSAVAGMTQNSLRHLGVRARLAEAESLAWLGETQAAAAAMDDAGRRMGDMRSGLPGIHLAYLQAVVQLGQGRAEQANAALEQALTAQAGASPRNFQIGRTNEMFDSQLVSPRVAVQLYEALLADPAPTEWALSPLNAMAVLMTGHDAAFDRWFLAALERRELPQALEIAEWAKRRRFLASLPLGGRIIALRTILEAPLDELSTEAVLQRQQLLAAVPEYRQLSAEGARLHEALRGGPVVAQDAAETRPLADRYAAWDKNIQAREKLLQRLALRRIPSSLEFPPLRATDEVQQSLVEGDALIIFHAAAGNLYGFLLTRDHLHTWPLPDDRRLRAAIGDFLQSLGNFGPSRSLSVVELSNDGWQTSAVKLFEALFADARWSIDETTTVTIVPDGLLWYVPFEALVPNAGGAEASRPLADRLRLRYSPTASLAAANARPLRRPQRTGIVANSSPTDATDAGGADEASGLEAVAPGAVRLSPPLPAAGYLVASLLDTLVVLDDVEPDRTGGYAWSPLPRSRGGADSLAAWFALAAGGPQRIVLAGFPTAAEGGLRGARRGTSGVGNGQEIFRTVCGLMASGARTILMTRWRTGGRINFELVREFVQELPHAPAAEAWNRAALLAREMPLDAQREPRLKRPDELGALPSADHPFFWAGYLLIDNSPPQVVAAGKTPPDDAAKPQAPAADTPAIDLPPLPPPAE